MISTPWKRFEAADPAGEVDLQSVRLTPGNILDYQDRDGYDPDFVAGAHLPLPGLGALEADAVPLDEDALFEDDANPYELKYRHFSVAMCRSRRQPFYSAVNINGKQSTRGVKRTDIWKYDPRIPVETQIIKEVYGKSQDGLFSRGHMTRREDPNWGKTLEELAQSDADTFHVTNACPQQQGFNAGLWLDLESYILDNTDNENIQATVLTGPIFATDDPLYRNIQVPVSFWKIVAFTHPETKGPAAIAYQRSQASFLPRPSRSRFVFGDFDDTQVSIASLAEETGLDLSAWSELDVLKSAAPNLSVRLRLVSDAYLTP